MLTKSPFIMGQSAFVAGSEPASLMQIFHTSSSCLPSRPPVDLDDLLQGEQQKLKAPELQQRLDQVMTQLCPLAAMVVTQGSGTVSPALLYGPAGGSSSSSSRHMCGSPASMLRQGGGSHGRRSTGGGGNGRCRGHATDAWHLPNPLLRWDLLLPGTRQLYASGYPVVLMIRGEHCYRACQC